MACTFSFPIQFYPAMQVIEAAFLECDSASEDDCQLELAAMNSDSSESNETKSNDSEDDCEKDTFVTHTDTSVARRGIIFRATAYFYNLDYETQRTVVRSVICTILMVLAICVPNVGLLISLFGSVGSSMLAVILPPVLYVAMMGKTITWKSWFGHWGIIVVGSIGMFTGTYQACVDILKSMLE